jgi:hypothetical protein
MITWDANGNTWCMPALPQPTKPSHGPHQMFFCALFRPEQFKDDEAFTTMLNTYEFHGIEIGRAG